MFKSSNMVLWKTKQSTDSKDRAGASDARRVANPCGEELAEASLRSSRYKPVGSCGLYTDCSMFSVCMCLCVCVCGQANSWGSSRIVCRFLYHSLCACVCVWIDVRIDVVGCTAWSVGRHCVHPTTFPCCNDLVQIPLDFFSLPLDHFIAQHDLFKVLFFLEEESLVRDVRIRIFSSIR